MEQSGKCAGLLDEFVEMRGRSGDGCPVLHQRQRDHAFRGQKAFALNVHARKQLSQPGDGRTRGSIRPATDDAKVWPAVLRPQHAALSPRAFQAARAGGIGTQEAV